MFDAHNHFTDINSIKCTAELLPQYIDIYNPDLTKVCTSEIGLDKRFTNIITMEKQIDFFIKALEYSIKQNIPITLHCVNATEIMIKILKEHTPNPGNAIWHGFNGSLETAKELNKLGILISIGPRFNKNLNLLFKTVNNVILETDYVGSSKEEHDKIVKDMYIKINKETNIPISTLEEDFLNATKAYKNRIYIR